MGIMVLLNIPACRPNPLPNAEAARRTLYLPVTVRLSHKATMNRQLREVYGRDRLREIMASSMPFLFPTINREDETKVIIYVLL